MRQSTSEETQKRHERLEHDDRRDEILRAVREACAEEGLSRFSVSSVTSRVGCTRSLFYHYFPDKESALDAVLDQSIETFIAQLVQWNNARTPGDIEGALDDVVVLMKEMILGGKDVSHAVATGGNATFYTAFVNRVADRTARYICESTVVEFERLHEVRIDHVYESFYVLITGLIMFIRTHPDTPDATIKEIIANTLHIEEYTEKYRGRRQSS